MREQRDATCPAPFPKIFPFQPDPNHFISLAVSPHRGAARDRHGRGVGCGGRGSALDESRDADGKAVWSWRPDAGAKFRKGYSSDNDGGKKARSPRRARNKPLKPLRGECRVISAVPSVTTLVCFVFFRTRGCGCIGHPAFPAPSVLFGANDSCTARAHLCRGNAGVCVMLSWLFEI